MAEYADSKHPIIQTWTVKIFCSCLGCQKNVKSVLDEIDGVRTFTIDPAEQKVTVTGTVGCGDVLLNQLRKKCGKHAELCPVTQNKPKKESKPQIQHKERNSGKDVRGDRKPKDPKQQTKQKPGNDGGGNANDNAAVVQSNLRTKTLKRQKEQNSGRQEDNGQVVEDALFGTRPIMFTMEALSAATNNFHIDNEIGRGTFGLVYKGTTGEGKQIAVKKLSSKSEQGPNEFLSETVLAKMQHRNIVKLLGCCVQRSEKLIVYDYIPNKSLDKWLSDPKKLKELDWPIRYEIILGIAHGLCYLHEDSQPRIVHRDIKPSNILLDEKLYPKITDFGTAKILPEDGTYVSTGRVAGTPGYWAPEYVMEGQLSPKADVYSYGIVLLEVLTGRKILSEPRNLLEWVWRSYKQDNVLRTIDPTIIETCDKEKASKCIQVGLLCTQENSVRRPSMSKVTAMLEMLEMLSTSLKLPVPTNPPGCNVRSRKVKRCNVRSRKVKRSRSRKVNPVDGAM